MIADAHSCILCRSRNLFVQYRPLFCVQKAEEVTSFLCIQFSCEYGYYFFTSTLYQKRLKRILRGVLSKKSKSCATVVRTCFLGVFFSNHKNSHIFPCTSQFCSIKNKKMSDDSSCSSNLDTFQMYQDFDIIFDDPIPRRDRWDHTRID